MLANQQLRFNHIVCDEDNGQWADSRWDTWIRWIQSSQVYRLANTYDLGVLVLVRFVSLF